MVWLWSLLFVVIAVGGLGVLVHVGLRVWRSARGLLAELDRAAVRAGELADLLAQVQVAPGQVAPVQVVGAADVTGRTATGRTATGHGSELPEDDAWAGTVESYHHQGADAPGKKES